jgi:transposase-like protein
MPHAPATGGQLRSLLQQDKVCLLVMIRVRAGGTKELIALDDGHRESTESSLDLLRGCKRRGMAAPVLTVGDGALGFWSAVREVFPETREHVFAADYGTKWPKAAAKITDDLDVLLAFYDYPAEHWIHLRTANPSPPSPPSGFASESPRAPAPAPPVSRWRSSSSNQHRPGGGPSTHPTSSR